MLGTDAGIIETGADRMRLFNLPVAVHQEISAIAVQYARFAAGDGSRVPAARQAVPGCLDTVDFNRAIVEERVKQSHGVGATAYAGNQRSRQPAVGGLHLLARLAADDALEVAHHRGIRMRAGDGADAIKRVGNVGDPVPKRLVHGVFKRLRTRFDGANLCPEHLHPQHIRFLPFDIDGAHVDDAGQPKLRTERSGGDAMHAGAGFGDDARLAHALGQYDLAEHVVHFVRAGVIELLALEVNLRAAAVRSKPLGEIQRRRPPNIICEVAVHFLLKFRIGLGRSVGLLQLKDQRHQRLGNKAAAIDAKMPALVGAGTERIRLWRGHAFTASAASAARAARMKALILSGSFSPGARSTPDDTSTPSARVMRNASATLPALSPPDSMKGIPGSTPLSSVQSNGVPSPPGRVASCGARASNKIRSATFL